MPRKLNNKPTELRPTDEQEAIIRSELKAGDCTLINAYAGTGKTATLEMLAHALPGKRILYICFNRETAVQVKDTFPSNTDCRTIHSIAFALNGAAYRHKLGMPLPLDVMQCLNLNASYVAVHVIDAVEHLPPH